MKKNIIITVLALSTVFFVILSRIKANEAEKQAVLAELNLELALKHEEAAARQEDFAVKAAVKAKELMRKNEELALLLKACK